MTPRLAHRLLIAAALLLAPRPADATIPYPWSTSCQTQPTDDRTILVGLSFGMMISHDGGQSWKWVCEAAIGYGGPRSRDFELAADGTIYAASVDGLRRSADGGCSWDLIGGPLDGHFVDDVELDADGTMWAVTAGAMVNVVATSTDGVNFTATPLSHGGASWKSVRVAPSDTQRIYVAGYLSSASEGDAGVSDPLALLYRSDDGGQAWTELGVGDFVFGSLPRLMVEAVHPTDPDTAYAVAVGANEPIGDALYRTEDAGASWQNILVTEDVIQVVEFDDRGDLWVGTRMDGVRILAAGRGTTWTNPGYQPRMGCMCEDGSGLYACGDNWADDFTLGRSTDSGASWTGVVQFADIGGPLECEPGTVQFDTCENEVWPRLCTDLGSCGADGGADGGPPGTICPQGEDCDDDTCLGCNAGGSVALSFLVIPVLFRRRRRRLL